MIITISGKPGSGKSTIVKMLAKKYNLKQYSTGDFFRQKAKEKGFTLHEFSKLAETTHEHDKETDLWQTDLGKKENDFIIDGRLSHKFIPNAIKIFLDVDKIIGALRIMKEKRDGEEALDERHALELWETRANSEQKRFHEYYKIDHHDYSQYDFVLNTSNLTKQEVLEKISEFISKHNLSDENFAKSKKP